MTTTSPLVIVPAGIRGITFAPNGQQCSGQLPAGNYRVIGECLVRYTDIGIVKESQGVKLQAAISREHWYVAPAVAVELQAAPELSAEQLAHVDAVIAEAKRLTHGAPNRDQLYNTAWTAWINSSAIQRAFPNAKTKAGLPRKSDRPADRFAVSVLERFYDSL